MSRNARLLTSTLLVAAWGGAALLTEAVVTPGAFAVLPTRTMSGTMVGAVLPALFLSGIAVAALVVLLSWRAAESRAAALTAALAGAACAVSQFGINPRIARLRVEIGGPVDALPADDARRVAFGLLHGYSIGGLAVAMLALAISLGFLVVALRRRSHASASIPLT